jgi:hypothetical protein
MKRQSVYMLAVALVLMGGTAAVLARIQLFQKLGVPGVRVVDKPVYDAETNVVAATSVDLPESVLDFTSRPLPVDRMVLNWLPKDTVYGQRVYQAPDGFSAQMNVVLMGADRTSIHKPQYCLTGQGWWINRTETDTLRIERPQPYDLRVVKLTVSREVPTPRGEKTLLHGVYVYWFVADKQLTADHVQRMWWMARDMLRTGVLQRWAYVSCFSICPPGQEETTARRMKALLAAAVPHFQLATGRPATPLAGKPVPP